MLKLASYPAAFGEPSASPFCVKAMCFLEMAGATWEVSSTSDPRNAPKSKLPVLIDEKKLVPDSEEIRTFLQEKYKVDFDEGLSEIERATSRAIIRMCDEHLYFVLLCERWLNDFNWAVIRELFFDMIPRPLRGVISNRIRKNVLSGLNGQGIARHSEAERFRRADQDILAIMALLGEKPFLFGERPSAADASAAPIFAAIAGAPHETKLSKRVKNDAPLMAYVSRVQAAIYPQ